MTNETASKIYGMIEKEITRFSLVDLCEEWGIEDTEDVWEFLNAGMEAAQ